MLRTTSISRLKGTVMPWPVTEKFSVPRWRVILEESVGSLKCSGMGTALVGRGLNFAAEFLPKPFRLPRAGKLVTVGVDDLGD